MRPPTWIEPGRLLVGRHPGAAGDSPAARIEELASAGVTLVVDLTEEGELEPYHHLVPPGVRWERHAVRDFSVPDAATLTGVLDAIDAELAAGGVVYLHCWAGCGRTGVVAGCWLVRHGARPEDALRQVAKARGPGCPQTLEQQVAILEWEEASGSRPPAPAPSH
jgi:protein-tyrosine phosphatase